MHPFASRQHREGRKSQRFQNITKLEGSRADSFEIETLIGVEVEHKAVGLFDILDPSSPRMQLDRSHLDAGHQPIGIVDIQVWLLVAVLFGDTHLVDFVAEAPGIMLLEKALLGTALRAPNQTDRPTANPGQHDLRDGRVVVRELALG